MASGVVSALVAEREEREKELRTLQDEWNGKPFSPEARQRYNDINRSIDEFEQKIELQRRDERMAELTDKAKDEKYLERGDVQFKRPGAVEDSLIFDVSTITRDYMDPAATGREFRDRAKRAIERAEFPNDRLSKEDQQTTVDRLLRDKDSEDGALSRHLLATGSPEYKRAFGRYVMGSYLSQKESEALEISRAMSLTGTSGGFAVPFELDPSIIPTSNLAINPYRSISRVVQINVDEWRGVSSAGITSAYAAEATAATDA